VDPFYLAFKAREHDFYPEFIELAGKVNQTQPAFCVERIERTLNEAGKPVKGSKILLLGVSYKAGVGDIRESPALKIAAQLLELGGAVSYHDPYVPNLSGLGLASVDLDRALESVDLVAIVTAHPGVDYGDVVAKVPMVVDFRGVTRAIEARNLVRL
jgi:UDP-N-acetyl-D-glucosamine dehydrogenase